MYDYRPIGIYSAKTMADEERKKKNFFEDSTIDDQQQKKKNINLIITLESDGKYQFDETFKMWEVRHIPSFANYESFVDLCKRSNFKNVAIVHHGNTFSDHTYAKSMKVVLDALAFKTLKNVFEKLPKKDLISLNDDYFEDFRKESEKYHQGGLELKDIKSYISLKLLLSNMLNGANFFSVACDEADDKGFLNELGSMTNKEIKIFANSNRSDIKQRAYEEITSTKEKIYFGSLLNNYLTPSGKFFNSDGWYIFNTKNNTLTTTKKDLWLLSNTSSEVYLLKERSQNLTQDQLDEIYSAQKYYAKNYKKFYIEKMHGTETSYNQMREKIKKKYPDIIK
ncbi:MULTISPECIES: hypothetical protein [Chryseobacterium]|uniref:Uncharacterized protein n=2 Tax=Chryseobacterium TaxID=59732 RepID=A0ABX9X6K2_9FLAO|nr:MULTISPECIES: hypothetical protein [Chryseobacterium]KYH06241.1 hypothetical protein A1704_08050 [Chryseobacterium cucumeris]MDH5034926.1 hypothetical protein [Chryseobacterium cucumeris]RKE78721.1 hypothetical protein DEU39_2970 [Chryseobacterium sp. AG363]ROH92554.1 hypothetical protein EGI15_09995 [Chryseobacterium cucumeris]